MADIQIVELVSNKHIKAKIGRDESKIEEIPKTLFKRILRHILSMLRENVIGDNDIKRIYRELFPDSRVTDWYIRRSIQLTMCKHFPVWKWGVGLGRNNRIIWVLKDKKISIDKVLKRL